MIEVRCPRCGEKVPSADLDIERLEARCGRCALAFPFEQARPQTGRPLLPPDRFTVEDSPEELKVRWRWFSWVWVGALGFYLTMGAFLPSISSPDLRYRDAWDLLYWAMPVLFSGFLAGLIYWSLAGLVNRSELVISGGAIRVEHSPLPWPCAAVFPVADVVRLDCRELAGESESMLPWKSCSIRAELAGGRTVTLASRLHSREDAIQLAAVIERRLGMGNRPATEIASAAGRPRGLGTTIQVTCPKCGDVVRASDMNLEHLLAKCSRCDVVFHFEAALDGLTPYEVAGGAPARLAAAPPKRLAVEESPNELRLRWSWISWRAFYVFVFCIAWNTFLLQWFERGRFSWPPDFDEISREAVPLLFAVFGAWLSYVALAGLINQSEITVSGGWIRVRHGPLPWPGRRSLAANQVQRIACRKHERTVAMHGLHGTHALRVTLRDGRSVLLVSGLDDVNSALYIAAKIEERLGLPS